MPADLEPGWLWMIGGVLLLITEIVAPGFFLVFIGAAALATGAFALMFGLGLPAQLALFALYSMVAVMIGRRVYGDSPPAAEDTMLNDRSARLIGRSVIVVEPVDDHGGRVRVGDSDWSARGGPAAAGERVRITGIDGNCLSVEPDRTIPPA
ncbi:MAG TPA: NfeD family protein [Sphingomicrobium sp.]|jgi:inner membrane protein|nr:NfeD family protein [Sphingomicrobium sp.]